MVCLKNGIIDTIGKNVAVNYHQGKSKWRFRIIIRFPELLMLPVLLRKVNKGRSTWKGLQRLQVITHSIWTLSTERFNTDRIGCRFGYCGP
jgi:hypothetical protein